MGAPIVGNVSTGKPSVSGGIWIADAGTTPPSDAVTTLGADYTALGYVSEDGLTNSNSPESDTGVTMQRTSMQIVTALMRSVSVATLWWRVMTLASIWVCTETLTVQGGKIN